MNVTWSRWEWDTDAVWSIGLVAVCLLAVGIAAACLLVSPAKKRSLTSCAFCASSFSNRVNASSSSSSRLGFLAAG